MESGTNCTGTTDGPLQPALQHKSSQQVRVVVQLLGKTSNNTNTSTMILPKPSAISCSFLAFGLLSLAAAEQPRDAAGGEFVTSRHLHPVTLVRTLDVLRNGRRAHRKTSKQQHLDDPLRQLRRVQEDDGQSTTCEAALAEAEENLAKRRRRRPPTCLFRWPTSASSRPPTAAT